LTGERLARQTSAMKNGLATQPPRTPAAPRPDPADESAKLGKRIRELRLKAGLTLTELAKATGISIGTLSQLERGLVSPTVRTLFTVGDALGVAPAWLIDPGQATVRDGAGEFIVRANQRARFLDSGGVRKDIASPAASERLKGFFMVIDPGCGSGAKPYTHVGEEIGFILSGTLELQIEDMHFTLNEGDCFCFSSERPHQFSNVGPRPASVFWVNARI
jgi:transcriptional regulator with XRE-family HTH domain